MSNARELAELAAAVTVDGGTVTATTFAGDGSALTSVAATPIASSVGIAELSATGTPSSSTYLRGDNTWATVVGGVTDVTATSPVVSSGGATPAISITQATTSTNGYLSSTDWNTFNNKTSNTGTVTSVSGTGTASGLSLSGTVTTSGSLTLGGTVNSLAAGTYGISISGSSASCTGNAATATTATTLTSTQSNWNSTGVVSNVVGMLGWKNYGNSHVIFDASAGTSPSGSAVDNTNSSGAWSATYPTLMGWNGSYTYGVRVDSARVADNGGVTSVTAGTGISVSASTGGVTITNTSPAPAFSSSFESAQQTIGSGFPNSATVSHGLGVQPKLLSVVLKCITADLGYAVGDEVSYPFASLYAVGGFSTWTSSTQCGFVVNANLQLPNKGSGTFSTLTYARWKVIIRAWA